MKIEDIFKFTGKVGIVVYLLGTWITSFFFMTDGPSSQLYYEDVSVLLNILCIISIITAILISKTNYRYRTCFFLMMVSSAFFVLSLYSTISCGYVNPRNIDVIKVLIYSLISNIILIISIVYSYIKYKRLNRI